MLFNELKRDNLSGASELLQTAAHLWRQFVQQSLSNKKPFDLNELRQSGIDIIRQQPRMASLFNLVNNVLVKTKNKPRTENIQNEVLNAIAATIDRFEKSALELVNRTIELIGKNERFFTYSKSSTVISVLLEMKNQDKHFKVFLCESRPMLEGQSAAHALTQAGIMVEYFVDAAMARAIDACDIALVGADSFSEKFVTNKIGTKAAALLARSAKKPIYALATTDKYIPAFITLPHEEPHPAEEIWPNTPKNISVSNYYFEDVPLELFTGVITEGGLFNPTLPEFSPPAIDPRLAQQLG